MHSIRFPSDTILLKAYYATKAKTDANPAPGRRGDIIARYSHTTYSHSRTEHGTGGSQLLAVRPVTLLVRTLLHTT